MLNNPEDHSSLIPVDALDRATFTAIDPLEVGQYSKPFIAQANPQVDPVYKFMYLKSRIAPHKATLDQDFAKIQEAAKQDKVHRKLSEWFEQRKDNTFIHINDDFLQCDELKLWLPDDKKTLAAN